MRRLSLRHDIMLAFGALSLWAVWSTLATAGSWPLDLSALFMAAHVTAEGRPDLLYAATEVFFASETHRDWAPYLAALGHADDIALPYAYPPIWAWLLAPLGHLDPMTFFDVARGLLFGCLAAATLLLWRLARPAGLSALTFSVLVILLMELSLPFTFAAMLGQPQLLLTLLILLAFERYAAGARRTAAVVLGIAAAIKLTPVLLCLIFLAERDWRTPALTCATAALIAATSLMVAGPALHLVYIEQLRLIDSLVPILGFNTSFESVMNVLLVTPAERLDSANPMVAQDIVWVAILSKALLIPALWLSVTGATGLKPRKRRVARLLMVTLATALLSPLAWIHYYLIPVMALPLLPGLIGWRRAAIAAIPVAVMLNLGVTNAIVTVVDVPGAHQVFAWFALAGLWASIALGTRRDLARSGHSAACRTDSALVVG